MNLLQHTSGLVSKCQKAICNRSPLQLISQPSSPTAMACYYIWAGAQMIQESFAAHFWANFYTWASAHDARVLCSTLLSKFPYLGQCPRYKRPLQLTFGPVSIWWHTTGQCPHCKNPSQLIFGLVSIMWHICTSAQMIQEIFAIHFWAGIQVSYVSWCPVAKQVLCSTLLGRCPSVI